MKGASFFSRNKSQDIFNIRFTGNTFQFISSFADLTSKRLVVGVSGYPTSYSAVTSTATTKTYTITGLTLGEKIAQVKTFNTGEIGIANFQGVGLIGDLNFTKWNKIEGTFGVVGTNSFSAITNPINWSGQTNSNYNLSTAYVLDSTGVKNLDLSMFNRVRDITINNNLSLTSVTLPSTYIVGSPRIVEFRNNNLTGQLNLTPFNDKMNVSTYSFYLDRNPQLTGITFPSVGPRVGTVSTPLLWGYNSNITGNLDLSMLSGFPVNMTFENNSNLTGITLPTAVAINSGSNSCITNGIGAFNFGSCDLQGTLDLSIFPNFGGSGVGGSLDLRSNTGLTQVILTSSTKNFNEIRIDDCNLTGNLNLSGLTGRLGGVFQLQNNSNLTGVTFSSGCTYQSSVSSSFYLYNCDLTGTLDLTTLSGLGGSFLINLNPNLTQILHGPSSSSFRIYYASNCNLTGTLDLSPLSGLSGSIQIYINPSLTNITFPTSVGTFNNTTVNEPDSAFALYQNGLNYVDFKPLSGATLTDNSRIRLQNNGMTASEVNQILVDFSGNATYNLSGWDNINLNIGGSNADPDSGSGGYDGLSAVSFLTGSPRNWTITY